MNSNDPKTYRREVRKEVHTDPQTKLQTSTTRTTESVHNPTVDDTKKAAYHDGYVHGQVIERHREAENLEVRDNNTAARALLLGIILTALTGLVAGALYFLNQRNESSAPAPQIVPVPRVIQPAPSPAPTQTIERERTIIERAIPVPQEAPADRADPVPQQPISPPDINITVPNTQRQEAPPQPSPAPQASPSPLPAPDININVPNSQPEPTSKQETPAVESSPAPAPKPSDDASEQGTKNETDAPAFTKSGVGDSTAPSTAPSGESGTTGATGAPGSAP